jgi:hypothetical protein
MIRVNILFLASRVVLVVSINYEKERWSRQAATLECINACRKKKTHILLDDAILFFWQVEPSQHRSQLLIRLKVARSRAGRPGLKKNEKVVKQ